MELNNDFRVSVAAPVAWKILTDLERIAPLMPGAQLQEVEGDEFRGLVKVKVGPITAQYKGTATFLEREESAGRMVLKAAGRDTRGQGNANATIAVTISPDGTGTRVNVATDLTITGKVAQFGRGVIVEISGKLINQFVDALEADLESSGADSLVEDPQPDSAGYDGDTGAAPTDPTAPSVSSTEPPQTVAPPAVGVRRIDSPEPTPVDLLDAAGGSLATRMLPLLGGAVALVALLILRGRRHRR